MTVMPKKTTISLLTADWVTHYNMGHPSMVADYHTEDGVAARAGAPPVSGRDAITASLEASMAGGEGAHLTIHDMGTEMVAEGWAIDGGWYTVNAGEGGDLLRMGTYFALAREDDDGWKLHWSINNGWPAEAMPPAM